MDRSRRNRAAQQRAGLAWVPPWERDGSLQGVQTRLAYAHASNQVKRNEGNVWMPEAQCGRTGQGRLRS